MTDSLDEASLLVRHRWCILGSYHHGAELALMVRPDVPVALRWDPVALQTSERVPVRLYVPLYLAPVNAALFAIVDGPCWRQRPYGLVGTLQAWDECMVRVGSLERLVYLVRVGGERAILEAWELGES